MSKTTFKRDQEMKLLLALFHGTKEGKDIISCEGKTYSPSVIHLSTEWNGKRYAMFDKCGMSATELKGDWKIKGE